MGGGQQGCGGGCSGTTCWLPADPGAGEEDHLPSHSQRHVWHVACAASIDDGRTMGLVWRLCSEHIPPCPPPPSVASADRGTSSSMLLAEGHSVTMGDMATRFIWLH